MNRAKTRIIAYRRLLIQRSEDRCEAWAWRWVAECHELFKSYLSANKKREKKFYKRFERRMMRK